MNKINDLDLTNWKESEIWTDSLWIISERDKSGKHSGFYHGNFVPQIPHQLILRYTKKNDVVLDPFSGSGTTAFECESLSRNFIGIDIQKELNESVKSKIDTKNNFIELIVGDSTQKQTFQKVETILSEKNRDKVQLIILHPPYFDILKFTDQDEDLSNSKNLRDFIDKFVKVVKNSISILEKDRYLAIIIGDKYTKGQWIPLGFYCMHSVMELGLTLKSVVVKNMEGNRAKANKEGIWRYLKNIFTNLTFGYQYA